MLPALLFAVCLPFVVRMNESLSRAIGYAPAAWAVHAVGAAFGLVFMLPFAGRAWWTTVSQAPWWSWLGGAIGCGMVLLATRAVTVLGVAGFTAVTVAVQLVVSAAIDHFGLAGSPVYALSPLRASGICLLAVGATMVVRG
jgi:bacterial/archaeal transporter family-2 protein